MCVWPGRLVDAGSYLVTLLDMSTEQVTVSTVVAEALTGWLRARLADAWLAEHQAEHGAFDDNELRELAGEVGVPYLAPGRTEQPTA